MPLLLGTGPDLEHSLRHPLRHCLRHSLRHSLLQVTPVFESQLVQVNLPPRDPVGTGIRNALRSLPVKVVTQPMGPPLSVHGSAGSWIYLFHAIGSDAINFLQFDIQSNLSRPRGSTNLQGHNLLGRYLIRAGNLTSILSMLRYGLRHALVNVLIRHVRKSR